ncbi:unnamed protein product [Penicillium salamii]|uniref:Uncharacterized protein n=1 Tax=Penicillium salamii TaxID=1612424 RepID=A0A9W4IXH2_9EURO|nr:unnamed protein product [Penicillium salamii]CAG8017950.1 unnamed protein product [Penicillium salamii]CAG8125392.1 unnamed protein product [Penicillium salamii]CAG8318498.1 unnamed protein product [Penicillium salamii]CAG8351843.1 unnamed protein product [Penicillium salamii]
MPRIAGISRGKPTSPEGHVCPTSLLGDPGCALLAVEAALGVLEFPSIGALRYTLNMADSLIHRHPLQRLPSPSRGISALVHLVGLSSFFWAFKYMHENPNQANQAYGWHFQYLTVIGLTLSTLTFFVGLLADITLSRRLFLVKNILSICSAPLEVLISVLSMSDWSSPNGWSFRFMPVRSNIRAFSHYDANFVLDLSFHATPSIVMLIDLLFLSPPWTITVLPALMVSGTIAFGYWFWIEQCFAVNGWYPYPIFEALPTEGRIGLFTLSAVVMALSTITLKWLFGRVNGFGLPTEPESRPGDIRRKEGL